MAQGMHIAELVSELERDSLLPAIVFRTSRSQCDIDAERAAMNKGLHLSAPQQRDIRIKVREVIDRYELDAELIIGHPHYNGLILSGIGAHHAGQLLMWRLMLEELMASGMLRVLVATGTVAAGVDFPARTVIVTSHARRGSDGYSALTSAELQQMSGRAGRRGRDTVGFCLAAPSIFCDARILFKASKRPPEPLKSSYFPGASTVLNLLRYRTVDGLHYTVERSLAAYSDRKEARQIRNDVEAELLNLPKAAREVFLEEREENASDKNVTEKLQQISKEDRKVLKRLRRLLKQADELEVKQLGLLDRALTGLRALGYVEENSLSAKGLWASNLYTSSVLELSEMIEAGIFTGLSRDMLAAVVACFSGDAHRDYLSTREVVVSKELATKVSEIITSIAKLGIPGCNEERSVVPDAAYTVLAWIRSEDWHQFRSLLLLAQVAEGDAARLITQTAEQLNQLTRLSVSHYELSLLAEEAKRALLRPPLTDVISIDAL